MLGVADPFMLAPTSGARFLGGLVSLGILSLLELLAQPRSPSHLWRAKKGLRPANLYPDIMLLPQKYKVKHHKNTK